MNTPTNLKEAVENEFSRLQETARPDLLEKFTNDTDLSPSRVYNATHEVLKEMGIDKRPSNDLLVPMYLEGRKQTDKLGGKQV